MFHKRLAVLLSLPVLACSSIRASSRDHLNERGSTVVLETELNEAIQRVGDSFGRRGFAIVDMKEQLGATVCKYKGTRSSITTVAGHAGITNVLGSVFYAFFRAESGRTVVTMLGKPTRDGKEVCSDHDGGLDPCEDIIAAIDWNGRMQMSGREEAEAIRGVMLEFKLKNPVSQSPTQ